MANLDEILNWRQRDEHISLSGQPTETQLADLADNGVTHIINLGPHTNTGALPDEAGSVSKLGMTYIYIPVDFENPTEADFAQFSEALASLEGQRIHVHCIYNARVTAFFYRHATEQNGETASEAFETMDGIWRPGGVWATFIGKADDAGKANRYEGYDY